MAVAATKSVTGWVTSLSATEIDGAVVRLDLDPEFVGVGDTIVVGIIDGTSVGELVTPVEADGSFSVDLVAVDDPLWTITGTVDGPNVETPAKFVIIPPPLTGTGSVGIGSLLVQDPSGKTPVVATSIRGASDYDDTVAPTDGQAIVWDDTEKKYKPGTVSGGSGSGLPSGGTVGQFVVNTASGTGTWQTKTAVDLGGVAATDPTLTNARTPTAHASTHATGGSDPVTLSSIGGLSATTAATLFPPITSGLPILMWNGTAYPAKPTGVTNGFYQGPAANDPGGVDGDVWAQTS